MNKRSGLIIALFILTFAAGVFFRVYNLNNILDRSPDEGIYTYQSKAVAVNGIEGSRALVNYYNANEKMWIYPPPTRGGYIWIFAFLMKIMNSGDVELGAYISCFFSVLSLCLIVMIGLEVFNGWIALCALLFMSVSPMSLAISRRAWQDAMWECMGLGLIYLCSRILSAPKKMIWYALFIITGSYAILIKESGVLIYGLCLAYILWTLFLRRRSLLEGTLVIASGLTGIFISIAFQAFSAGGFSNLIDVMQHVKKAMPNNAYAIAYQTGPWHRFFLGFWILSPLNSGLCLLGFAAAAFPKWIGLENTPSYLSENKGGRYFVVFFMTALMLITAATPYCQNMRYVSAAYGAFYLISALGLWYIILSAKKWLKGLSFRIFLLCLILAVIFFAVKDYKNFVNIFVKKGLTDLSIGLLLGIL